MERAEQPAARLLRSLYVARQCFTPEAKVAIVAIMRKHLILANALIRDQRK